MVQAAAVAEGCGGRLPGRSPRLPLGPCLERLARSFGPAFLSSDPIELPRRYPAPEDREIAAFVAASLAFGNAKTIRASAEAVLGRMGPRPSAALDRVAGGGGAAFPGTVHRWVRGADLTRFLRMLGRARRQAGSLESFFLAGDPGGSDLRAALASFVARLRALDPPRGAAPEGPGLRTLLASPETGSACKRWNMLLRWLVRPDDGIDLGLWRRVSPSRLVIPLDTHVARIGRSLGLTRRATDDWKTAAEITRALSALAPDDPTRFDFALSRLGILGRCPRRRDARPCAACELRSVCAP